MAIFDHPSLWDTCVLNQWFPMHFYDSVLLHMYKSFKVGWEHQRKGKIFRKIDSEKIYVDGVSQQRVNEIYIDS